MEHERYIAADVDPHHGLQLVHHGYTVLVTNADGTMTGEGRQGLFDYDTRVLSTYQLLLNGRAPRCDSGGLLDPSCWIARLTVDRPGGNAHGPQLPQDAIELTLRRSVGNGMIERLQVDNHSATAVTTSLVIQLDTDFRDIAQIGGWTNPLGHIEHSWDQAAGALLFDYHATHGTWTLHRALRVHAIEATPELTVSDHRLTFDMRLLPRGSWRVGLVYEVLVDDRWRSPIADEAVIQARHRIATAWRRDRAHVESDPPAFGEAIERAAEDLGALRNWEHEAGHQAWIPNAGLPIYTGLFGRDALTAGWQASLISSELLRGALARLAASQAAIDSPWHDAEPGKMVHEMRRGPLSELGIIPQRAYYGTQTSASFFVVTLSELWHWTGDTNLVRDYLEAALRVFDWAERYGDCDGDGFLEYRRRSTRGLKNQGWKDSDEAIRYPDGALVENPIATVEEQAYHCLALQRMAEMLLAVGDDRQSAHFVVRARRLRAAWQRAFWMEEQGFYAMALDPAKRQVRSIGSNAGHALAAGLVPREQARRVADRLMAPDLFSGWGIRTLSADHPSYNPLAYHLGTVWPVENATFALGFKRYGLDAHVERLVTAIFQAADRFRFSRLPEALGGHPRDEAPIPTVYPAANSPQAWSASATIQAAQTVLGIYPFAPAHLLALVKPALPPWLSTVTLRNMRVGDAHVSIAFTRQLDGTTTYDVLDKTGRLHVLEVAPPQDAEPSTESWRDALIGWILAHAPGRVALALRLAFGDDP
jgi:glycogen debranching enzyme